MTEITEPTDYRRIPLKVSDASVGREIVLGEATSNPAVYVLRSIPAFVYGTAPGDHLELLDAQTGEFVVRERGGSVAARIYLQGSLDRDDVKALIATVVASGGIYEVGFNREDPNKTSLLLLSFSRGFELESIRSLMSAVDNIGGEWEYVNVYDEEGRLLDWIERD